MRTLMKSLLTATLICLTAGAWSTRAQSVTLIQITDAHLFDSAKHRPVQAGFQDYLDNRSSLAWAVRTINDTSVRVPCLDFVAFTGDFGIEDTDPIQAAREVAIFFRAIAVKRILLVPGNNDLANEDPHDLVRFRAFVDELALLLPDHQVVDLTRTTETFHGIRVIGLNSATFKNDDGKLSNTNAADQLKEMQRVAIEVAQAGPSIILTHIPNLEDPHRGDNNQVRNAWNVATDVSKLWQKIVKSDELLAVFAGHFHDARREVYMQDYRWASNKPSLLEGAKTWVAPPLAVKFQTEGPQARGLLLVTVASSGTVNAVPKWFTYPDSDRAQDKRAALFQAEAEADHNNWRDALPFYAQALSSDDATVRSRAEHGYLQARKGIHDKVIFSRILWAAKILLLLIIGVFLWFLQKRVATQRQRQGKIVIETPSKLTKDAPIEFFAAALVSAANEIQSIYRSEQQRSNVPLAGDGASARLSLLSGAENALRELTSALPEVHGVKVGKVINALPFLLRFSFTWRVESGLAICANNEAYGHSTLRWRSATRAAWIESAIVPTSPDSQQPAQVVLLKSLAWKLASDILSRDVVDRAP